MTDDEQREIFQATAEAIVVTYRDVAAALRELERARPDLEAMRAGIRRLAEHAELAEKRGRAALADALNPATPVVSLQEFRERTKR